MKVVLSMKKKTIEIFDSLLPTTTTTSERECGMRLLYILYIFIIIDRGMKIKLLLCLTSSCHCTRV